MQIPYKNQTAAKAAIKAGNLVMFAGEDELTINSGTVVDVIGNIIVVRFENDGEEPETLGFNLDNLTLYRDEEWPEFPSADIQMPPASEYQVKVWVGCERSEDDYVYHGVQLTDPDTENPSDAEMIDHIRNELDVGEYSTFKTTYIYANLPETLVERIKADGVKEYLADQDAGSDDAEDGDEDPERCPVCGGFLPDDYTNNDEDNGYGEWHAYWTCPNCAATGKACYDINDHWSFVGHEDVDTHRVAASEVIVHGYEELEDSSEES